MKLSLSTCSLNAYEKRGHTSLELLQAIRRCGFTAVDFDCGTAYLGDDYISRAKRARSELEASGLTAAQGHAPCLNPLKEDVCDVMRRALTFCRVAGIPQIVIHPGATEGNTREEFFDRNCAFYRSLISCAEDTGVGVLIENIGNYADPYYLWNGKDLRELVDRVAHPLFTACWDAGHANLFWPEHTNQYDSILALGDRLTALHIHDNCGYFGEPRKHNRIDMHTMPFFSVHSNINYDAIVQGLKDAGYRGTFNFEVMISGASVRDPFVYNGRNVETLSLMPLEIWIQVNTALYGMGKFMLESYGVFDG